MDIDDIGGLQPAPQFGAIDAEGIPRPPDDGLPGIPARSAVLPAIECQQCGGDRYSIGSRTGL